MKNEDWIKSRRDYEYHTDRFSMGKPRLYCDRANSFGTYAHPSCIKNEATKKVTILHGEYSKPEYLVLCAECASGIAKQARGYGYKVKIENLSQAERNRILAYAGQPTGDSFSFLYGD